MPTTHTLLILERIYTGKTVPDGMGGSSVDQSNTPHPNREEQAVKQTSVRKTPARIKRNFLPVRIAIQYSEKTGEKPESCACFPSFLVQTLYRCYYCFKVLKLKETKRKIYRALIVLFSFAMLLACGTETFTDRNGEIRGGTALSYQWLIGAAVLLLCVLTVLFVLFLISRNKGKRLENLAGNRTEELEHQHRLMSVVNDAAALLLESEAKDYLYAVNRSMEMICRCIEVDRVYLWQNSRKDDGKLYYRQVCKWMSGETVMDDSLVEFSYEDTLPNWEKCFFRGESLNGPLDSLPDGERSFFPAYQLKSLLAVPLFIKGTFWGFVSFDDCKKRRVFSAAEEHVLRSWGLLVVGAFERGKIALDLEAALKAAKASSEAKSRFLANMSHEMRTPLNAIIGLSELELGAASLEGDSFINVEKIYSAGMSLLGIINDILDISKIGSGNFTLVPVVYDVPSMINDTINLNIVRIGSKPIQFRLHIDSSLPSELEGDELRIKQIFNNLLSNAIKYTDSGFVDWTISCVRQGDRVKVTSTVQDTGKGINEEDQKKIFLDYFQTDLKANYYVEGTGLGLSITSNLIKLMDGTVSLKSEYQKGSVFTVEFFQKAVGDEVIGEETAANLSQLRYTVHRRSRNQDLIRADMSYAAVLVVDDVDINLDVARGMLIPYKLRIDCVTSGQEAVDRVREEKVRYSAIFMDHMMPGMDGIEAVRIIRNEINTEYARTVPIIALTANALIGNDEMFLQNGFQAFLSKPIDIIRLDRVLHQWVRDKNRGKTPPSAIPPTPPKEIKKPEEKSADLINDLEALGINAVAALARFANDQKSYLHILGSFVVHAPSFIEDVRAFKGKDISQELESYRITVHSIKGSGRGIGAEILGDMAEKLEFAAKERDIAFIEANNDPLIEAMEKFIADLSAYLQTLPKE
jgi:signal transduction histidine kinase/DNA-binding NarL/FixJ family response regulator/HPt (histidine-containing phosphotransfer) domain-containing protein